MAGGQYNRHMNFDEARQAKFDRGAKEHGQLWDLEHIDARREMMDELLDLANYSTLVESQLGKDIYRIAACLWNQLSH